MDIGPSTYTLNARQVEQALGILRREQQVLRPSPPQEKAFKLLRFFVLGFAILFGLTLLIGLLALLALALPDDLAGGVPAILISGGILFGYFLLILLIPISIIIGILFFFNLPLFRKLWQHSRMARRLGLVTALRPHWRVERQKKWLPNVLLFLAGIAGVGVVGWGLVAVLGAVISGENLLREGLELLLTLLAVILVGVALITTYFTQRSKDRLDLVDRLHTSFEAYGSPGVPGQEQGVAVPAETYQKIARIEREQISRERAQSILTGLEEDDRPYFVQKSHEASRAQAALEAATRLRVQHRIDALTTDPRPPGAVEDPGSGLLHLRVPDTRITVSFAVDDEKRRIQVLALRPEPDDAPSSA